MMITNEMKAFDCVMNFLEYYFPYDDADEYADGWKKIIEENPVSAYETMEEYGNNVNDCNDDELSELFDNALDAIYDCVLSSSEVM